MIQNKMRHSRLLTIKPIPHVLPISVTSWQAVSLKLDKRGFFFTLFAILKEWKRKNRKNSLQKKNTSTWLKVGTIWNHFDQSNIKQFPNRNNDCDVTTCQALWRHWQDPSMSSERQLCTWDCRERYSTFVCLYSSPYVHDFFSKEKHYFDTFI